MVDMKSVRFGGRPSGIIDTPYASRQANICDATDTHTRPA